MSAEPDMDGAPMAGARPIRAPADPAQYGTPVVSISCWITRLPSLTTAT
jgi:hypothetical protein